MSDHVLTLNAGSSSLKFGLFREAPVPEALLTGQIDRIGGAARLSARDGEGEIARDLEASDHAGALSSVLDLLAERFAGVPVDAVGHRVVHGGPEFDGPAVLDDGVIAKLDRLCPFAPLHQPHNLAGVRAARAAFPQALQVACFDTSFHRAHPWVNDVFALPRSFYEEGVRRYGFHGLSYDYIASALAETHPALHDGRVIVAHLGNGASMCGMRAGRSVGSTMGFSALDGLPMGTRCGQLDPGVILYLMTEKGMDAEAITDLLYRRSGLLGLSGISNDMRRLEASEAPEAGEAIDYFVFRIKRELGALAAVLEGLDAIVFTGGIGEHSALVRGRVCAGLGWLGVAMDAAANEAHAPIVSADGARVTVLVIPTNEELVIARKALAVRR